MPLLDNLLLNFGLLGEQSLEVSVLLPLDGKGSTLMPQLLVVLAELFVLKQLQLLVVVPDGAAVLLQALYGLFEGLLGVHLRQRSRAVVLEIVTFGGSRVGAGAVLCGRVWHGHVVWPAHLAGAARELSAQSEFVDGR